ncbi:MAG: DUF86 domain-containing protein [Caldilineaceae bacterium]|nr:DUF86 domain-containing protein [Caldilineaceae bacterium]
MKTQIPIPEESLAAFCRRWQIVEMAFFGWVLRNDFRPDSDIDVLVSFAPEAKHSLFDRVHMQEELQPILNRKVDLVSRRGIEMSRNDLRKRAFWSLPRLSMDRDRGYLLDMLASAKLAVLYVDITETDFLQNIQMQDAVIRRIEILGEAARRISSEMKTSFPTVPWHEIIGMRNLLIHEYDGVDLQLVWQTVQ